MGSLRSPHGKASTNMSEALFRYLTLLQLIPRLPARISTPVLQEKLAERGYFFELRTLQRDLRDKLPRYFPIISHDQERPFRWRAQFNLPSLDPASALAIRLPSTREPSDGSFPPTTKRPRAPRVWGEEISKRT